MSMKEYFARLSVADLATVVIGALEEMEARTGHRPQVLRYEGQWAIAAGPADDVMPHEDDVPTDEKT